MHSKPAMNRYRATQRSFVIAIFLLAIGGCATPPVKMVESTPPAPGSVLKSLNFDRALEDHILALDPQHINDEDVRVTLAAVPAPQLILVHGGLYPVHLVMISFADFLVSMGYPEAKIRRPDGGHESLYSYSPYEDSKEITGVLAWHYEHDGVRPMMIGHSQGGVQLVKVLYDLAGADGAEIHVWNPVAGAPEERTSIVDPLTGATRPVVGLTVPYASAVGVGVAALALPNQWNMVARVRDIPNSVEDFTGYAIGIDIAAGTFPGARGISQFHHNGTANVRNVILPWWYNHIFVPASRDLAASKAMRDWINAYVPDHPEQADTLPNEPNVNVWWTADVWYSIKEHWCLEAQRLVRAKRASVAKQ